MEEGMRPVRTGVLIVGGLGLTGSATIAGVCAMKKAVLPVRYATTGNLAFASLDLVGLDEIVFGAWDLGDLDLPTRVTASRHLPDLVATSVTEKDVMLFPGITTGLDFGHSGDSPDQDEACARLRADIRRFREISGSDCVVVVNLASPSRRPADGWQQVANLRDQVVPSSVLYAWAALEEGAHFVDFTPSYALEYRILWELASARRVQLSGRDGSTGQTMLKVTLKELIDRRGLGLEGWYSTNLLGNHDGLVLTTPGFDAPKIADKHDALGAEPDAYHRVQIEFAPPWGDRKESWDAVELSTSLGGQLSLRVNWRGSDSELAGAMIIDLVRLIELGARRGESGFIPQLGFFFKRPYLRESTTISERWSELVEHYSRH